MFVGTTWVTPLKANQEPGLDSAEPAGHEMELGFKIYIKIRSDLQSVSSQNLRSLCEGAVQYINIYTRYIHTLRSIPRPRG